MFAYTCSFYFLSWVGYNFPTLADSTERCSNISQQVFITLAVYSVPAETPNKVLDGCVRLLMLTGISAIRYWRVGVMVSQGIANPSYLFCITGSTPVLSVNKG